jgi:ABC-type dipeptide/oligopeptide/nickel transport system permease component
MIMALSLLIAFLWSITNLLTDLLYTWVDPRLRFGAARGT